MFFFFETPKIKPIYKTPNFYKSLSELFFYFDEEADYKYCEMNQKEICDYNKAQIEKIKEIKESFDISMDQAIEHFSLNLSKEFRKNWHLKKSLDSIFYFFN